ncbi:MAG TPA: hypothetical protein DCM64_09590 [Gammaproteobacteria bacterium]|nr:hypothetical protein [Gammaproteobacteria bacterium]
MVIASRSAGNRGFAKKLAIVKQQPLQIQWVAGAGARLFALIHVMAEFDCVGRRSQPAPQHRACVFLSLYQ